MLAALTGELSALFIVRSSIGLDLGNEVSHEKAAYRALIVMRGLAACLIVTLIVGVAS